MELIDQQKVAKKWLPVEISFSIQRQCRNI